MSTHTVNVQADYVPPRTSPWQRGLRTLLKSKTAVAGALITLLLLALAVTGPSIAPYDPTKQDLLNQHSLPSLEHWLGTDHLGRDVLSRMLHGARISVTLSVSAVGLAVLLGVPIGMYSAYQGGMVDEIVSRIVDIMLAFPTYLLAIFVMAIVGPSLTDITVAVSISVLPGMIRIARGDTLGIKNRDMIEAIRSVGAKTSRIIFRHVLPNILSSILVVATLRLGIAILVESSLSFLGLGLSPPTPAWGVMINEGLRYLGVNPWLSVVPGIAIMLTVLGFNLLGDGLRDAFDPRLRGERH